MRKPILLTLAFIPFMAFAQQSLTVTVDSAGNLLKRITEARKYKNTELIIKGPINGTDVALINDIAKHKIDKGDASTYLLKRIDLSDAEIVEGKAGMKTKANVMPDKWFADCKNLEAVVLPNTITNIGEHAFDGCTNLVSVTIPSSVRLIDNGAFQDCI